MADIGETGRRPRRGRKAAATTKPGLGAILSARVSHEVKEALEAEADRTGRSISQVAERWLDEARKGQAAYVDRLGGAGPAIVIEAMAHAARLIRECIGDPASNPNARTALLKAWEILADRLLTIPIRDPGREAYVRVEQRLKDIARDIVAAKNPEVLGGPILRLCSGVPSTPGELDELSNAADMFLGQEALIAELKLAIAELRELAFESLTRTWFGLSDGTDIANRLLEDAHYSKRPPVA